MKLIPNDVLNTHLQRLEMAESVTFTNEFARDLLMQALAAPEAPAQAEHRVPQGAISRVRKALADRGFREASELEDLLRMAANVIAEDGTVIQGLRARKSEAPAQAVSEREALMDEVQQAKDLGRVFSPERVERLIRAALTQQPAAQAIPAAWREAVKVAFDEIAWSNDSKWQADRARAALAQLDALTKEQP